MKPSSQRILTGLIGAPIVLVAAWYGDVAFVALVGLAALGSQYELYQLAGVQRHPVTLIAGLATGAAILLRAYIGPDIEFFVIAGVIAVLGSSLLLHREGKALFLCSVALAGVLYPTLMLSYVASLRVADAVPGVARQVTVLTIVAIWTADTAAYFVGRRFGKHHMSPISPKKTWEGFVGGVAGSIVVVAALSASGLVGPLGMAKTVFIGLAAGLLGPVGDLAESSLKRSMHVKDSGAMLPGHGGLLDRLDALILVGPIVYAWAVFAGIY